MDTTSIVQSGDYEGVIALVLDSLGSDNSRDAYRPALQEFLAWREAQGRPPVTRALVQRYKRVLEGRGLAPSSVNVSLSAIRKLAAEAEANGILDPGHARGIAEVRGVKQAGVRTGNWLTREQAQRLLNAPDTSTLKGLRDRAMLAVMLGGGLRRAEVVDLKFSDLAQREGRWVLVDLVGKGGKLRTVPIPPWVKAAIDEWANAAGISTGKVFRGVYRYGKTLDENSEGITTQLVWLTVKEYLGDLGLAVAPHDLRRTFAKLSRAGGGDLDQIQQALGHSSISTTQRYLGTKLDLQNAACDHLGLTLEEAE